MSADRFEGVLIGLIYFAGGFAAATMVLYSELRRVRRRAAMLETRIMECKTGAFRMVFRYMSADK